MKTGRKTKAQLAKELEALRRINATIGTLLNLEAVLQRIIDEMILLFAAQAASVILFDYGTQEAEITTAYGQPTSQKKKPLRYAWQGSFAGWIIEHRRSLRLSRPITREWPTSAKLAEQLGGSLDNISVLLAPLWQNDEVIGCLEIVWDPQRDITVGDEQFVETMATQVVIAIANARLYQEKELALQAAKETEERYRDLVDNSEGLICTHDLKGVLLSVNPAAARAFRAQPEDLVGRNLVELLAPSVREFLPAYLAQIQQKTKVHGLMRVVTKTGEERVLVFHNIQREEPGREPYVVGHGQDITERKRAEEALQYQLAFEQLIASVSKDFIELAPEEIDDGILRALKTIGEFSGVDRGYLFLFSENLTSLHNTHEWCAPDIEPVIERMRIMPTSSLPWAGEELRNARVVHIARVSELPPAAQAEKEQMQIQGIQSMLNVPILLEKTLVGFLGFDALRTEKRWSEEGITLLSIVGEILVYALERKWAADRQQLLQMQLLQTQKLEAVGTLASGIAHDFNNILTAIVGYTELAMDDVPDNSLTRRNLENVLAGSRRAKGLIQQLLTFSRPSHQDRRPVSLYNIIEGTVTLLQASLPKNIDIRITQPPWTDTILANSIQIEQIVMNLCVNAAYAIGERGGVIRIGIDSVVAEHGTNRRHLDVSMGASIRLTVSDTGSGMAPEMLGRIFEPFFTTKPVGQGSGLGLAIVHAIVTSHGGRITVASHLGQGTTFQLYFPPFHDPSLNDGVQALERD